MSLSAVAVRIKMTIAFTHCMFCWGFSKWRSRTPSSGSRPMWTVSSPSCWQAGTPSWTWDPWWVQPCTMSPHMNCLQIWSIKECSITHFLQKRRWKGSKWMRTQSVPFARRTCPKASLSATAKSSVGIASIWNVLEFGSSTSLPLSHVWLAPCAGLVLAPTISSSWRHRTRSSKETRQKSWNLNSNVLDVELMKFLTMCSNVFSVLLLNFANLATIRISMWNIPLSGKARRIVWGGMEHLKGEKNNLKWKSLSKARERRKMSINNSWKSLGKLVKIHPNCWISSPLPILMYPSILVIMLIPSRKWTWILWIWDVWSATPLKWYSWEDFLAVTSLTMSALKKI